MFLYAEIFTKACIFCRDPMLEYKFATIYEDVLNTLLVQSNISFKRIRRKMRAALILADLQPDLTAFLSGFLYLTLPASQIQHSNITSRYGSLIYDVIYDCRKIYYIAFLEGAVDERISMMISHLGDHRSVLIHLAACLHKVRHLNYFSKPDAWKIAISALSFYSHLAYKLDLHKMKREMQMRSFKHLHPVRWDIINKQVYINGEYKMEKFKALLSVLKRYLKGDVKSISRIKGRMKDIYSIYHKISIRRIPLNRIKDIFAFRIVTDSVSSCYTIMGKLHSLFTPLIGYSKDYIGNPKPNGYQALHTTFLGLYGLVFEIQICTHSMERMSHTGKRAHHMYKSGTGNQEVLQNIEKLRDEVESNIYSRRGPKKIYALTPKKRVIALPIGSTVLDFAYKIHTLLGRRAHYAIVNTRQHPLHYVLNCGDKVEIVTADEPMCDSDWLTYAKLPKSLRDIRKYLNITGQNTGKHEESKRPTVCKVYTLCKVCWPVYEEEGCVVDRDKIIHLASCRLSLSGQEMKWQNFIPAQSYRTSLYLYHKKSTFKSKGVIKLLVYHEIMLINFVVHESFIKIHFELSNISQLYTLIKSLEGLEYIISVQRTL